MSRYFVPLRKHIAGLLPGDVADLDIEALDSIWASPAKALLETNQATFSSELLFEAALVVNLPIVDGVALTMGGDGLTTVVPLSLTITDDLEIGGLVGPISTSILINNNLLRPARLVESSDGTGPNRYEIIPDTTLAIEFGSISLGFDLEGNFDFDFSAELTLPPAMIGDSGFVIQASGIIPVFSELPPGTLPSTIPSLWRGVFLEGVILHLPPDLDVPLPPSVNLIDFFIGTGGISGTIQGGNWSLEPLEDGSGFTGLATGELFGIPFGLKSIDVEFFQSIPIASSLAGEVILPFFDSPVAIDLSVDVEGGLAVALSAAQHEGASNDSGLVTIEKEGLLSLTIDSLGLGYNNDVAEATISGSIKPLVGAPKLDWPSFEVKELTIDSDGNVKLDGGWMDLRQGYTLDFYGFQMEITKLGFGKSDDGGKWVGFSGSLNLVEGISAGASVEGLRITWYDDDTTPPKISLNGAGVELLVPDVLHFQGEVSFREYKNDQGKDIQRFDGRIGIDLLCLGFGIDGQVVFGIADNDPFMAIFLEAELPAGIPLVQTGLAFYGLAGLTALQMLPNKKEDEPWYDISHKDWFHRDEPGVAVLTKWDYANDAFAIGAGITIGTLSDNGYTFSGRMLLVVTIPGPVIFLEGRANLLKERSKLSEEPAFHSLAVLDFVEKEVLFGVDARFAYDEKGSIISIGGSTEAYFKNPNVWHLYIGKEQPINQRISADIFQLFKANSWFELDMDGLNTGMWVGWSWEGNFLEIVSVKIAASIEGGASLSFRPIHFHGYLGLYGMFAASVFGFGFGLELDARIDVEMDKPSLLLAHLGVTLDLPWPFDDIVINADLALTDQTFDMPPLPRPLQEVAVEHFKTSTSWPLQLGTPDFSDIPVVPIDSRPHITFKRSVNDLAFAGINPGDLGWERIGDPNKGEGPIEARYSLVEIELQKERLDGPGWDSVAKTPGAGENSGGLPELYGSWAPVPQLPSGEPVEGTESPTANTKLWLWSKNPFDYTRRTTHSWDEWFTDNYPSYPCLPIPESKDDCYDFMSLPLNYEIEATIVDYGLLWVPGMITIDGNWAYKWHHPENPALILIWTYPSAEIEWNAQPVDGMDRALHLSFPSTSLPAPEHKLLILLDPAEMSDGVSLRITSPMPFEGTVRYLGEQSIINQEVYQQSFQGGGAGSSLVDIRVARPILLEIEAASELFLYRICIHKPPAEEVRRYEEVTNHIRETLEQWENKAFTFEPNQVYRLRIETSIETKGADSQDPDPFFRDYKQTEYAYFRTEGPPGFANLSLPVNLAEDEDTTLNLGWKEPGNSGEPRALELVKIDGTPADRPVLNSELNDLNLYVAQTIPPTVPKVGEKQPLPRPVYRAYDVGIIFNEDYVATIYRQYGRDLALYLFDANDRLVRDSQGRLIVIDNHWGESEVNPLSEPEVAAWVSQIEKSPCITETINFDKIVRTPTVSVRDCVLDADIVYEARIIPSLLKEDFSTYAPGTQPAGPPHRRLLGLWQVLDQGSEQGPSDWKTGSEGDPVTYFIHQHSSIFGGDNDASGLVQPGTMLVRVAPSSLPIDHPDSPANWSDYRFHVQLRSSVDEKIGVVFRYNDTNSTEQFYRFSMGGGVRQLILAIGGEHCILAEDDFSLEVNKDYRVTVEAIGDILRIYQDGDLIFNVEDSASSSGSVGLYCSHNPGAYFTNILIDDLREAAPVLYRFAFTTSLYANFYHQLHSYDDESWLIDLDSGMTIELPQPNAVPLSLSGPTWPALEESKSFEKLVAEVSSLSEASRSPLERVEVSKIVSERGVEGFFVASPEPIDWCRTTMALSNSATRLGPCVVPKHLKITEVKRGNPPEAVETVTVLLREARSLANHRLEIRTLGGPIAQEYQRCTFFGELQTDVVTLFDNQELRRFDRGFEVQDEGRRFGPSQWHADSERIVQTARVFGGPFEEKSLAKPGTIALLKLPRWDDVRIRVRLRTSDKGDIGLVFRYKDASNYYRFSLNREWGYLRLVKNSGGRFSVLWEQDANIVKDRAYVLEINAVGNRLIGKLDGELIFDLHDRAHRGGGVALYCWYNGGARFEQLEVDPIDLDKASGRVVRKMGSWQVLDEEVSKRSRTVPLAIGGRSSGRDAPRLGEPPFFTHATAGEPSWTDYRFSVSVGSESAAFFGLLFRYQDSDNTYRFSVDQQRGQLNLIKQDAGVQTVLAQTDLDIPLDDLTNVVVDVVDDRITAYFDETLVFDVRDSAHSKGRVGLYYHTGAKIDLDAVSVCPVPLDGMALFLDKFPENDMSEWVIHDSGTIDGPSDWFTEQGSLRQMSNIRSRPSSKRSPKKLGTHAVAGDLQWANYVLTVDVTSKDDDAVGVLFRYQDEDNYYRFSMDRERGYRHLARCVDGQFEVLWSDDYHDTFRYEKDRAYELTIVAQGSSLKGYMDGIPVFSVCDSEIAAGKIGLYTWANNNTAFSNVRVYPLTVLSKSYLLLDDFERAFDGRWSFVDEGRVGRDSVWRIENNRLKQLSNIHDEERRDIPAKPGTMALAGSNEWYGYRVSVRLETEGDNDAIGVVFRYLDKDNYYRFSMDHDRMYRRLIKKVDGRTETLWEDTTRGYQLDREYIVTVDCMGDQIRVYLDGAELVELRDTSIQRGKIGLYCYANRGAIFEQVEVIEPSWILYKQFDKDEEVLAAGTKVVVQRQGSPEPDPMPAGTVLREAEPNLPAMGEASLELRLVDGNEEVLHARRFIPDSDFHTLSAKVLRNADGTKLILMPESNPTFENGTYRLSLCYRRDVVGDDLPKLSQAGDQSAEVVYLEFS